MSRLIRRLLGDTALYPKLKSLGHYPDYYWWVLRGQPERSPHLIKQRTVTEYAERYRLRTLVETGTYYGEMVDAMLHRFGRIYSIEFDSQLAGLARRRFEPYTHVRVLQGDSQRLIPEVLLELTEPCLFWLDAGYYGFGDQKSNSGRLDAELTAILSHRIPNHVILLDDARGLTGQNGTLTAAELTQQIERQFPHRKAQVSQDILQITPR